MASIPAAKTPKVDDCPRFSAKQSPARVGSTERLGSPAWGLLERLSHDRVALHVKVGAGPGRFAIRLLERPAPRGVQFFLICPLSGLPVRSIHFDGERVGSRGALGLSFSSQSMSKAQRAERRKDRLVEQLSIPRLGPRRRAELANRLQVAVAVLGQSGRPCLEALIALEDHDDQARRRRKRERPVYPVQSTRAAMSRGHERRPFRSAFIREDLDRAAKMHGTPKPGYLGAAEDLMSRYPELDIRAFKVGQGRAVGRRLIWQDDGAGNPLVVLSRLDLRRKRLVLRVESDSGTLLQVISVVGGKRPADHFFLCPVSGKRCLRLYFRSGRFAGREVQHLKRPSEWIRSSGRYRASDPL